MNGWYWSVNGWRLERILNYYHSRNSSLWKNYLLLKARAKFAMWHMIQHTNPKLEISVPERSCVNNLLQQYKIWPYLGQCWSLKNRNESSAIQQFFRGRRREIHLFYLNCKPRIEICAWTIIIISQQWLLCVVYRTVDVSLRSLLFVNLWNPYILKKIWVLLTRSQTHDLWWLSHGKGHHGCKAKLGSCGVNRELREWKCTMSTSLLAGS